MSVIVIIITVAVIIWFIILYGRKTKEKSRLNRIVEEKRQDDELRLEVRKRIRTDENAAKNQEERDLRLEQEANQGKIREDRDSRERELRQKISDRKKHESEEGQRKAEEK
jgi:hypothetical protein